LFISRGHTRSRSIPGPPFTCYWEYSPLNGPKELKTHEVVSAGGIQITESDGNRWPPPKGGDFIDCGSEFFSIKKEWVTTKYPYTVFRTRAIGSPFDYGPSKVYGNMMIANCFGSTAFAYQGSQTVNNGPFDKRLLKPNFPPDLSSTRSQLEVKGQIAAAACAPSNQVANAASAVAELLRDMPSVPGVGLWKARLRAAETLAAGASEFLNGIFGILPTISDMTQFYTGVHKVDRTVDQFIRDSGRVVRRHFVFPKERTQTETDVSLENGVASYSPVGCGTSSNGLYNIPSQCLPRYKTIRTRVVEREIWFSGAFTYYLPPWFDTHDRKDRMRLTAKLLGAEPDLNTLWQLAPWSWAVDWFVNAGTWIKSLQALLNYGTVMRYGYVMEKTTITDTYSAGAVVGSPQPPYNVAFTPPYPAVHPVTLRTTVKKRIQANPFGFGLSWDGMSPVQKAIVAALGITRVVR
jgi:hypothetical protein